MAETNPMDVRKEFLEMWSDILQRNDIGYDQNFLELGGDSLSAMLCISRVQRKFGVELFVEDFFMDTGTVEELSRTI
jgi:acyl carrier protein